VTDAAVVFDFAQVLPGRFHMPARMTALPLAGGGVALVSPIPIDDALASRVEALGPVRYLVAPNLLHHLYLGAAQARWPSARVLAPDSLRAKRPDLTIDGALEDGLPDDLSASVEAVKIDGAPTVDEHVLFHRASATLVVTDLLFHVVRPRGLVAHVALWLVGCRGRLAQSRAWRLFVKDRAAAARSARTLMGLDFDRLVPAHGDVIDLGARPQVERALAWMLSGEALLAPGRGGATERSRSLTRLVQK